METKEIDEKDWIKLMYVEYIIYIVSTSIGPYVCNSWNITKKIKIMQCSSIKSSPLSYINGFSWKENNIMHLLFKNAKKHFFEWNFV
jgi:hypothetical protein